MEPVDDEGKVWIRGKATPVRAYRKGDKIVAPGGGPDSEIEVWVENGALLFDLHDRSGRIRVLREFPLSLTGETRGTLFSGFDRTKHADVDILTPEQKGVREFSVSGESYSQVESLTTEVFISRHRTLLEGSG